MSEDKLANDIKMVPKGWGFEKWIVNNEEYCGKLLYLVKGKKCSWHYHVLKDEVFYVQSGRILLFYSEGDDIDKATDNLRPARGAYWLVSRLPQQSAARADRFRPKPCHRGCFALQWNKAIG